MDRADTLIDSMSAGRSHEVDFSTGVIAEEGGTAWRAWMVGVESVKDTRRRLRRSVGGSRGTIEAARVDDDVEKCGSGSQQ